MAEAIAIDPIDPAYGALAFVAEHGLSLRKACERSGINKGTLWLRLAEEPALLTQYARARELQAEHDASRIDDAAQELLDLARSGTQVDNGTVQAYARAIDALKWAAARKHPKVYGDRIDLTVERTTVVRVAISPALEQELRLLGARYARQALGSFSSPNTIDVHGEEVGQEQGQERVTPAAAAGAATPPHRGE